jgi:hypothetical protein
MAKQKTKPIPFSNKATETSPGEWEWEKGGYKWKWRAGYGINLVQVLDDGSVVGAGSFAIIKEAAIFTEGFYAGAQASKAALAYGSSLPLEKVDKPTASE